MAEAFYHHGFTIEFDSEPQPSLRIDGRPIRVVKRGRQLVAAGLTPSVTHLTLPGLGRRVVEHLTGFKKREETKSAHVRKVGDGSRGRAQWNHWRESEPEVQPLLYGANLRHRDLRRYDFSYANLTGAQLQHADLRGANFHQANLGGANLFDANLARANLCRTDLYKSTLREATLTNANLQGTGMAGANLSGATLLGCKVYGLSAWDLKLDSTTQHQLRIRYDAGNRSSGDGEIEELLVNDLEMAQLLFFLLRNKNENIRKLVDAMARQIVLILGRFTPERKAVLDKIRNRLREKGLIPIIFDFPRPDTRNLTETVSTIAHLAKFAIADLTDARSIPQELQRIVPSLPSLPIQPVILASQAPYSMFRDFGGYRSVLLPFPYKNPAHLLASLDDHVIAPVEKRAEEIQQLRQAFERALFQPVADRTPRSKRHVAPRRARA